MVYLNQDKYPEIDFQLDFENDIYAQAFADAVAFRSQSMNISKYTANSNINPVDYEQLYPLFVFNLLKQDAKLRASILDIQVRVFFSTAPEANTLKAYAVILSDKVISLQGDGKDMAYVKKKNI